jgi:hypothetical protein
MILGRRLLDRLFPINPKYTHNFLELTYKINELSEGKHKFEVEHIKTSRLYFDYFLDHFY